LPRGSGPINVVSTLALMDYDRDTCRMRLAATHPGVTVEEVVANTGFDLIIPEHVGVNEPPSAQELRLLREEIDPERFYI
jgi:glutaconate CoA-transferase subunit B